MKNSRRMFAVIAAPIFLLVTALALAQLQSTLPVAAVGEPHFAQAATPAPASVPAYPDSSKGLEKLMKDMLKLDKSGNFQALTPLVQVLVLPDAGKWFESKFGQQVGDVLAGYYERVGMELPISFPDTLASLVKQNVGNPQAIEFTDSCNPNATEHEYPILILRRSTQPMYDVRFFKGSNVLIISYFAYVAGAFRYLGNFQVSASWPIGTSAARADSVDKSPERLRVGTDVQAARIIHQTLPEYPVEARLAHIEGTVLFHAIIARDGSIGNLQLIQGQCWLAEAARKAVQQWRYKPMLLKGKPVEVDTTIRAIFNIR